MSPPPLDPPDGAGRPAGWLDHASFAVQREIGRGGMATIYLALERAPPYRRVALKVVHPHLAGDELLLERFRHEVRAHLGLAHPNVVEMIGWGQDAAGNLFLAMEYVDGPTLKDVLARTHPLPLDVAVHVARGVLQGLGFAHQRSLVHRDVKPANVMLTKSGQVKIADFGIAKTDDMTKLTSTGMVIGTPAYMSPEQALAKPIDGRSDLFSAGVVLYEMLSGQNPFAADNPATTLSRVVGFRQRRAFESVPHVPALVEEVLESMLQKDPGKRPAVFDPLVAALDKCAREEGLSADDATLAAFLGDPDGVGARLDAARAARHFERGMRLYGIGPANAEAALWDFFLATLLDPKNAEARTWLEQVTAERGFSLQRRTTPRMKELEKKLEAEPDHLHSILQLAKLHSAQGNFLEVVALYRRAKALRPPDKYTQNQIDTLVSPQAAPIIDGTGVFAAEPPTVVAPKRRGADEAASASAPRAEGVGDFLSGVLSTGWGKAALVVGGLAVAVIAAGLVFDVASRPAKVRTLAGPVAAGEEGGDAQGVLDRAEELAAEGKHAKAEELYRRYLEESPDGARASEARFRLGDALERQGKRPDALVVHAENAELSRDAWAARSLGRRGELLLLDSDHAGARAAYEAMAQVGEGGPELEARRGLASVAREEGRADVAIAELEALLPETSGDLHRDVALDLAALHAAAGGVARAEELYRAVQDESDHKSEAFRRAGAGLAALRPAGAAEMPEASEEAVPVEPPAEEAVPAEDGASETEPPPQEE